jgi:ribonuclease P protein component
VPWKPGIAGDCVGREALRHKFTKADRLLKRREFVLLSRGGKKIHTRHFLVLYLPGEGSRSRLGITVTKKVAGAPGRNRIKRIVREAFRTQRHTLSGCWDLNVVAKPFAAGMRTADAFEEIRSIFSRIAQLHDDPADPHRPIPSTH